MLSGKLPCSQPDTRLSQGKQLDLLVQQLVLVLKEWEMKQE
jgi:hypothetical protein